MASETKTAGSYKYKFDWRWLCRKKMLIELYFTWLPLSKQQNEIKDKYLLFIMCLCMCLCVLRMLVATLHLLLCEKELKSSNLCARERVWIDRRVTFVTNGNGNCCLTYGRLVGFHFPFCLIRLLPFMNCLRIQNEQPKSFEYYYEYERFMNEICTAQGRKEICFDFISKTIWNFHISSILFLVCCMRNGIFPTSVVSVRNNNGQSVKIAAQLQAPLLDTSPWIGTIRTLNKRD